MNNNSAIMDMSAPGDINQENRQESREARIFIHRCYEALIHASNCRVTNCSFPYCKKMILALKHTTICKRRTQGGCSICNQLFTLCCYHVHNCQETECSAPCSRLKLLMKQKGLWGNSVAMPHNAQNAPRQRPVLTERQKYLRALQQLMAALRSPYSEQQQGEIVRILNSNPALMDNYMWNRRNAVMARIAAKLRGRQRG